MDGRETEFVDEARQRLVGELIQAFDDVADRGGVRVVSLEAPRGWGKTRVVHEFYAGLAAREQEYWPPRMADTPLDGPRTRHVVYPAAVSPPAGAGLPWLWWGISCQLRPDGRPAQVVADAITQVEAHGAPLLQAAAARGTIRESAASLAVALLGSLVPVVGAAATGAGAVADLWDAIRASAAIRRNRAAADGPDPDDTDRADLVERAIGVMRATDAAGIPAVVIVDDAHRADASLVRLLDRLVREGTGRALIVTTAWPDELEAGAYGELLRALPDEAVRRVHLRRLDQAAMRDIIVGAAPATADAVVQALVARADGNPLVLNGLLENRRVRRARHEGRIDLTPEQIMRLPNSYRAQLEERWRDLDEPVREAFAIAALQGREFLDDLVSVAGRALDWHEDLGALLPEAADALSWVRRLERFYVFQEAYIVELGQAEVREMLDESEVRRALLQMGRSVQAALDHPNLAWVELPSQVAVKLMQIDVRIAGELDELKPEAFESALHLGMMLLDRGADADAEFWLRRSRDFAPSPVSETHAVGPLAVMLRRLGRDDDALALLEEHRRLLEDGAVDAALLDKQIAEALVDRGEIARAEAVARRTLLARDAWAQQALTVVLLAKGDIDAAAEHQASVLGRITEDNVPPSSVGDAHRAMAEIEYRRKRFEAAIPHAQAAARIFEERFGPHQHETLRARESEALALRADGDVEAAHEILSDVVAGYGETGDRWLLSRAAATGELARTKIHLGDIPGATGLLEAVLPVWESISTDDPNAQLTRDLLDRCEALIERRGDIRTNAVTLIRAGSASDALEQAAQLVATSAGEPDIERLRDRSLLAAALWHADRAAAAGEAARTTAELAAGLAAERRYTRERDRVEAWMHSGRSGYELPADHGDIPANVRDALLSLAAQGDASPLLEMAIRESVELLLIEAADPDPATLASAAVGGVLIAAERLRAGYPTFTGLATSRGFRQVLQDSCREVAADDPATKLLTRITPAVANEASPHDPPQRTALIVTLWTVLAIIAPNGRAPFDQIDSDDLNWATLIADVRSQ